MENTNGVHTFELANQKARKVLNDLQTGRGIKSQGFISLTYLEFPRDGNLQLRHLLLERYEYSLGNRG